MENTTRPEGALPLVTGVPEGHSPKPTIMDESERAVCDRCSMPAIQVDGVWQHAEAADAVFCAIVMGGAR